MNPLNRHNPPSIERIAYHWPKFQEKDGIFQFQWPHFQSQWFQLLFQVPSGSSPALLEGICRLFREDRAFACHLEKLGFHLRAKHHYDFITIGLHFLQDGCAHLQDILQKLFNTPIFEATGKRIREKMLRDFQKGWAKPGWRGMALANAAFFGSLNYAFPSMGLPEAIKTLRNEAIYQGLQDLKKAPWKGIAIGCLAPQDLIPQDISKDEKPAQLNHQPKRLFSSLPGAVQGDICFIYPIPEETAYFPLLLCHTLLAGSFSSYLNLSLREEKGWTYGVQGILQRYRRASSYLITTAVQKEAVPHAIDEIQEQCKKLYQNPIPQEKLNRAKRIVIGKMLRALASPWDLADKVVQMLRLGEPLSWLEKFHLLTESINEEAVREVAYQILAKHEPTITLVGDPSIALEGFQRVDDLTQLLPPKKAHPKTR